MPRVHARWTRADRVRAAQWPMPPHRRRAAARGGNVRSAARARAAGSGRCRGAGRSGRRGRRTRADQMRQWRRRWLLVRAATKRPPARRGCPAPTA
eukprot:3366628-Prymnesium_polylepis.1